MAVINEILNGHVMLRRKLLAAKRMLIDKQFQSLPSPRLEFRDLQRVGNGAFGIGATTALGIQFSM